MHLVQSVDQMSDIHSTITTASGCLFYQQSWLALPLK